MTQYIITDSVNVLYHSTDQPDLAAAIVVAETHLGLALPDYSIDERSVWVLSPVGAAYVSGESDATNTNWVKSVIYPLIREAALPQALYNALSGPQQAEIDAYALALNTLVNTYAGDAINVQAALPVKPVWLYP